MTEQTNQAPDCPAEYGRPKISFGRTQNCVGCDDYMLPSERELCANCRDAANYAEAKDELTTLRADNAALTAEVDKLRQMVTQEVIARGEFEQLIHNPVAEDNARLSEALRNSESKISVLESDREEQKGVMELLEHEANGYMTIIEEWESDPEGAPMLLKQAKTENAALKARVGELEADNDSLNLQVRDWQGKYQALEADNARLSEEVERLKNERDEFEKRLTESIYGGRSIAFDPDDEIATVEAERDALRQRLEGVRSVLAVDPEIIESIEHMYLEGEREHRLMTANRKALALLNENKTETSDEN